MDLLLRGAKIIDGSGVPAFAGDVSISGDTIEAVGDVGCTNGVKELDLSGLTLAPGFIDIHTHYDAQVLWDPDITPSSWHGVTSVVMGNCGFGIAPTRPEHRETIARTLENVEGMSAEALEAGIPWSFETFPEYLDAVESQPLRINVAAMIGHTPLRLYVMGDEATERPATEEEIGKMRDLVAQALEAGAAGFATSKSPTHAGAGGKPVPSRIAEPDEIFRIAQALRELGKGVVQVTPGPGLFLDELSALSKSLARPVTWTALLSGLGRPGTALQLAERTASLGGEVWPQIACRPLVMQVTLEDPFPLAQLPSFKEVLATERRRRVEVYADTAWRDRARPEVEQMWGKRWQKLSLDETERHPELAGLSLPELAERLGTTPFDAMIEVSLEDDLRSRFRMVLLNDDEDEVGALLADKRCVLGLSDAGAHASQLCDACFSTHLLSHWVRDRKVLTLEEAVWRLTGQPSELFKLGRRGLLRPGYKADLVAFDSDKVGTTPAERVWDLPAGADRLVVQSTGIEYVWVGGVAVRSGGCDIEGARPGKLLR